MDIGNHRRILLAALLILAGCTNNTQKHSSREAQIESDVENGMRVTSEHQRASKAPVAPVNKAKKPVGKLGQAKWKKKGTESSVTSVQTSNVPVTQTHKIEVKITDPVVVVPAPTSEVNLNPQPQTVQQVPVVEPVQPVQQIEHVQPVVEQVTPTEVVKPVEVAEPQVSSTVSTTEGQTANIASS